jgi:hypothetical protein
MSVGVIFMGKTIKGSCGGLNAIAGVDKCLVCKKISIQIACCTRNWCANELGKLPKNFNTLPA